MPAITMNRTERIVCCCWVSEVLIEQQVYVSYHPVPNNVLPMDFFNDFIKNNSKHIRLDELCFLTSYGRVISPTEARTIAGRAEQCDTFQQPNVLTPTDIIKYERLNP